MIMLVELNLLPQQNARPSSRCPWCMQDVNRLGAECRFCEDEEYDEPATDPIWSLPNQYWLNQFGRP